MCPFRLGAFKIFSLPLACRSLTMLFLDVLLLLLWFYFPFHFEFTKLPESKNVCFLPKLGNFQHTSLNIFFCLILSPLLLGLKNTYIRGFGFVLFVLSHRSLSFCSFLKFFLLILRLDNSYLSICKFIDSFFCYLHVSTKLLQ